MSLIRAIARTNTLLRHLRPNITSMAARLDMSSAAASSHESEVLFETVSGEHGGYRLMKLNKPKTLNALNINMIDLMTDDLKTTMKDDSINFIVVVGGEKAFCAGGDIKAVTDAGKVGAPLAKNFFIHEYQLNYLTGTLSKPYVAIIDGITMGGGVGISVHSPFRVATETTTFAMPETAIGLFPDVGGGYFLPQLQGHLGMFLSLTGQRLKGRDVFYGGVATHFIAKEKIPALMTELTRSCDNPIIKEDSSRIVKDILDDFHTQCLSFDNREFSLNPYIDKINECFRHDSVEDILTALQQDGSEWAIKQLQLLNKMSPSSLKVTHRQVKEGKERTFKECLMIEYRLSQRCMAAKDFYEGVRAVLIDKDNAPKWDPPTLDQVTNEILDHYFSPLTADEGPELYVRLISEL